MINNESGTEKPLPKSIKQIDVGKFYLIHDGSRTGHPGFVVWKDDEANRYLVIRTDSDKPGFPTKESRGEKHITKLTHPTEEKVTNSYVHNRPMMCKRKDLGSKELIGMRFHDNDLKLINDIAGRKPEYTPTFHKK